MGGRTFDDNVAVPGYVDDDGQYHEARVYLAGEEVPDHIEVTNPALVGDSRSSAVAGNAQLSDPLDGLDDDASIPEVLEFVGDDPVRARAALDRERGTQNPRKGVVEPLSSIAGD